MTITQSTTMSAPALSAFFRKLLYHNNKLQDLLCLLPEIAYSTAKYFANTGNSLTPASIKNIQY